MNPTLLNGAAGSRAPGDYRAIPGASGHAAVTHFDDGLNMDNLEETSQAEIDAHLIRLWRNRGPLYAMSSISIMLDHRPDFAKLHRRGASIFGRPDPTNELVGAWGTCTRMSNSGSRPASSTRFVIAVGRASPKPSSWTYSCWPNCPRACADCKPSTTRSARCLPTSPINRWFHPFPIHGRPMRPLSNADSTCRHQL